MFVSTKGPKRAKKAKKNGSAAGADDGPGTGLGSGEEPGEENEDPSKCSYIVLKHELCTCLIDSVCLHNYYVLFPLNVKLE